MIIRNARSNNLNLNLDDFRPFNPRQVFFGGADGIMFDFADWSTLYTDDGITNVTAIGDAVYRANDLSGNAHYGSQATSGARPVVARQPYGGRRNKLNATATLATQNVTTTAVEHTISFEGTGTLTLTGTSTAGPLVGTGVGDRVSLTFTPTAGTLTVTVSGSTTDGQLQVGAAFDSYQNVIAPYDVTESGVEDVYGLYFDGTDDFLDLTATSADIARDIGQLYIFAGVDFTASGASVRPVVSIATGVSTERAILYGAAIDATTYAIRTGGRRLDADGFSLLQEGQNTFENTVPAADFAYQNSELTLRKDGTVRTSNPAFQTAGNTSNTASTFVYVGRIGSTYFGGFQNSLVLVSGSTMTDANISNVETWARRRIGGTGI